MNTMLDERLALKWSRKPDLAGAVGDVETIVDAFNIVLGKVNTEASGVTDHSDTYDNDEVLYDLDRHLPAKMQLPATDEDVELGEDETELPQQVVDYVLELAGKLRKALAVIEAISALTEQLSTGESERYELHEVVREIEQELAA